MFRRRSNGGSHDPPRRKRHDIEGLRAVAILAVVGFHAGLAVTPGGFVGVDVFFVISGFLITGVLLRDLEENGRVSLAGFYARRCRRLLPSSVLVLVTTVAVSAVVLPVLEVPGVTKDALAAAFYVGNYRFAAEATNYLGGSSTSPLLHYWSLGVEEQFYLVWPMLLILCTWPWYRRRHHVPGHRMTTRRHQRNVATVLPASRIWLLAALVCVGGASLALSLWLTRAEEPWAFFSLPTRAWELAIGGVLAVAVPIVGRVPQHVRAILGWCGLAAIGYSAVAYSASTPFPGTAALVPVGGAFLVIMGGTGFARWGAGMLLETAPLRFLGSVSYTWYLWHWPALVLAPSIVGHALSPLGRLVVVLASLGLAVITSVLLERPLQYSVRLGARQAANLALAAALGSAAAGSALAVDVLVPAALGHGKAPSGRLLVGRKRIRIPIHRGHPASPAALAADRLTERVQQVVRQSLAMKDVPANLKPSIAYVASGAGMAYPFWDGCFDGFTDTVAHPCNYGDVSSRTTVFLFGDSHAMMWFPALDNVADAEHWHLVVQAKATCPPLDVQVFSPDLFQWYDQCDQWREAVLARIAAARPAVVVLGFSREYGVANDHVLVDGSAWMAGLRRMITTLRADGSDVVVLGDVPYPATIVPDCLAAHLSNLAACEIPKRRPAISLGGITEEERVVAQAGGRYINTEPWFCAQSRCAVVIGNKIVYHDDNHLAAPFVDWLTPVISADLRLVTPARLWSRH